MKNISRVCCLLFLITGYGKVYSQKSDFIRKILDDNRLNSYYTVVKCYDDKDTIICVADMWSISYLISDFSAKKYKNSYRRANKTIIKNRLIPLKDLSQARIIALEFNEEIQQVYEEGFDSFLYKYFDKKEGLYIIKAGLALQSKNIIYYLYQFEVLSYPDCESGWLIVLDEDIPSKYLK